MSIYVDNLTDDPKVPQDEEFIQWVNVVLSTLQQSAEVGIRIVDVDTMSEMNQNYRQKTGPTNVLTFVTELPEEIGLGTIHADIVLCAKIINKEADEQNKSHLAYLKIQMNHDSNS